jgi:hypothetical protein
MLSLEYVIKNSGDSTLKSYEYSSGVLVVLLCLGESDINVFIKIKTDTLSFKNIYLAKSEALYKSCHIEIQELSSVLTVTNGVYVPSVNFGEFMQEKEANYYLAYGEKATSVRYIFSLVGYGRLISCLLIDMDSITVEGVTSEV